MPSLQLTFDNATQRYRGSNGRFVARRTIVDAVNSIVIDTENRVRQISQQYIDGKLSVAAWQSEMTDTLRAAHTLAAGIGGGGKANMTPRDWGRLGALTREQYKYLNRFALQLEDGKMPHFGRATMYARAVRNTFLNFERARLPKNAKGRWVLNARESCHGANSCTEQSKRGLKPVSSFPLIGSRLCLHNCLCTIEVQK